MYEQISLPVNIPSEKQLVLVEWRDIIAHSGWEQADEVNCPTLRSVGWLVCRDEETVKIANTLDYEDFANEGKTEVPISYGITAFPRGCVVSITPITA